MKNLLLILTALAVTATPLVSLVGCSNADQPDDLEKYKVTKQEMEDAISLKGVSYLQTESEEVEGKEDKQSITKVTGETSPTVTHQINVCHQLFNPYLERFVVSEGGNKYTEYTRKSQTQEKWDVDPTVGEEDFVTPQEMGEGFLDFYTLIGQYDKYKFDEDKKCYFAETVKSGVKLKSSFYFENKEMIKCEYYEEPGSTYWSITSTFTYNQITPVPPAGE